MGGKFNDIGLHLFFKDRPKIAHILRRVAYGDYQGNSAGPDEMTGWREIEEGFF